MSNGDTRVRSLLTGILIVLIVHLAVLAWLAWRVNEAFQARGV